MANLTFSFNNVMRASGYPVRAMVTLFIGTGVNVVLAPTFIFLLGWGIKGAAIATDIAMTVTAVFVMAHFFNRDSWCISREVPIVSRLASCGSSLPSVLPPR